MQNKHQEHPEDLILTGQTWVVDAMFGEAHISLKIDGAPSIVWGTHPHNGRFFVGTKSVFNKRLIKIAYSAEDVDTLYPKHENVRNILKACLLHLPRTEHVFQGDFIGFGGDDTYTPNTLTYKFPEVVTEDIIVAPHTEYYIPGEMWDAEAFPLIRTLDSTSGVRFVQPFVDRVPLAESWAIDRDALPILSEKEAAEVKVRINQCIREGHELTIGVLTNIIGNGQLAAIYKMVMIQKQVFLDNIIVYQSPACYLNGERVLGEGITVTTDDGMFKIVDRAKFSYANFTGGKFQTR